VTKVQWPEKRGPDDRMRIYRVVITADVANNFGEDSILDWVSDLFEMREAWDVIEIDVKLRRDDEDGISE
jgi:hypothetical protein